MAGNKTTCITSEYSSDLNERTLLLYHDPRYQPPTPTDVRNVIRHLGLTGSEVAARVGVSADTVRKWQATPDSPSFKPIPYAPWRLLLIEAGLVLPPST